MRLSAHYCVVCAVNLASQSNVFDFQLRNAVLGTYYYCSTKKNALENCANLPIRYCMKLLFPNSIMSPKIKIDCMLIASLVISEFLGFWQNLTQKIEYQPMLIAISQRPSLFFLLYQQLLAIFLKKTYNVFLFSTHKDGTGSFLLRLC